MSRLSIWTATVTVIVVSAAIYGYILPDVEEEPPAFVEVTENNFDELISTNNRIVLLNFWTKDCPPSLDHDPILREVVENFRGELIVGNINLDEQKGLGIRCGIVRVPTLLFMKNGKLIRREVGVHSRMMINFQVAEVIQLTGLQSSSRSSESSSRSRDDSAVQESPVR